MDMQSSIGFLLSFILLLLSILHFYWAFGGSWGFAGALPTNENGKRMLNPKKADSTLVGLILLSFSIYYLNEVLNYAQLAIWIKALAGWAIPVVFLLRAVGDFKYIGFLKKIKNTSFARSDSRYYSPLCLLVALLGGFMKFFS